MDNREQGKITAFDTLFTTNHIQILKIVMSCLDPQMQKKLAVYIKYLEFQYTLSFLRSNPSELCGCSREKEEPDIGKLCSEILPYCTSEEKKKVEQISGLLNSLKMYREMSQTMEMMKDIFPEGFEDAFSFGSASDDTASQNTEDESSNGHASHADGGNMMDMLMSMLSPEQKTMFEMFGGNSSHESD